MKSQMGRGLKTLFPKIPEEAKEEEVVNLGKMTKYKASPAPKRKVEAIFSSSAIAWKTASVSVSKIQIPEFIDCSRGQEIKSLEKSISSIGLLCPVLLRKQEEEIELVAGYRRLLAFKNLGIKRIPARIAVLNPRESLRIYRESNLAIQFRRYV